MATEIEEQATSNDHETAAEESEEEAEQADNKGKKKVSSPSSVLYFIEFVNLIFIEFAG